MQRGTASASGLSGKLRGFSPETARLTRLLFNTRLRSLGESVGVRLEPSAGSRRRRSHVLEFRAGASEIRIAFEAQSIPALAIAATTREPVVRNALASLLLDERLGTLSRLLGRPIELTSFSANADRQDRPSGPSESGVAILVENTAEHTISDIVIDAGGDLNALEDSLDIPPANVTSRFSKLAVPGRVVVGTKCFRPELLRSIRSGDVLLSCFQSDSTRDDLPNVTIFWGASPGRQMRTRGHLKNRSITIEEAVTMTDDDVQDIVRDAGIGRISPLAVQDLELPVQLELDSLALPLGKLCSLLPGQILELPVPIADTQIRLVSYGQTLGVGRLVAVGENLGLQIVRMAETGLAALPQQDGKTQAKTHAP